MECCTAPFSVEKKAGGRGGRATSTGHNYPHRKGCVHAGQQPFLWYENVSVESLRMCTKTPPFRVGGTATRALSVAPAGEGKVKQWPCTGVRNWLRRPLDSGSLR